MVNRFKKNSLITLGSIVLVIAISLASLSGCSSKEPPKEDVSNKEIAEKGANNGNTQNTGASSLEALESTLQSVPDGTNKESGKPGSDSKSKTDDSILVGYINLLGLSKDKLADTLNEKPNSADEGGLEFEKAGIRVWFDPENGTSVSQIFTIRKDIDLNGVRIGDKIDKFKETFGEPVSDRNGDMHFKYQDVFLSVNYDTSTRETYALYILKEDF